MSTLANVAQVYTLFLKKRTDLTVSMLVDELGMAKSSASRLLRQMTEQSLLERDKERAHYRPSLRIIELAYVLRSMRPLSDLMFAAMNELSKASGYTCYISTLDGDKVRVVHAQIGTSRSSTEMLQATTYAGSLLPVAGTSTGRALLSRAGQETLQRFLPKEAAARNELEQKLDAIRAQGWAMSINESIQGVASFSSVACEPSGNAMQALCISVPASLVTPELMDRLTTMVSLQASQIGRAIGDPYWLQRCAPDDEAPA